MRINLSFFFIFVFFLKKKILSFVYKLLLFRFLSTNHLLAEKKFHLSQGLKKRKECNRKIKALRESRKVHNTLLSSRRTIYKEKEEEKKKKVRARQKIKIKITIESTATLIVERHCSSN